MTVREAIGMVTWYLKEVSGEADYDRYVAHRREEHSDEPVMCRADWERLRQDERDRNPRARCC